MIGNVTLNREEIKKFIIDYFSDYKDIKVYFKETCAKTGTGIVVSHSHETKNGSTIKLNEELEIDDVKEIIWIQSGTDYRKNRDCCGYYNIPYNVLHSCGEPDYVRCT